MLRNLLGLGRSTPSNILDASNQTHGYQPTPEQMVEGSGYASSNSPHWPPHGGVQRSPYDDSAAYNEALAQREQSLMALAPSLTVFSLMPQDTEFNRLVTALRENLVAHLTFEHLRLHGVLASDGNSSVVNHHNAIVRVAALHDHERQMAKTFDIDDSSGFFLLSRQFPRLGQALAMINGHLLTDLQQQIQLENGVFIQFESTPHELGLEVFYRPHQILLEAGQNGALLLHTTNIETQNRLAFLRALLVLLLARSTAGASTLRAGMTEFGGTQFDAGCHGHELDCAGFGAGGLAEVNRLVAQLDRGEDLNEEQFRLLSKELQSALHIVEQSRELPSDTQQGVGHRDLVTPVDAKYLPSSWLASLRENPGMAAFIGMLHIFLIPMCQRPQGLPRLFPSYYNSDILTAPRVDQALPTFIPGIYLRFNHQNKIRGWLIDLGSNLDPLYRQRSATDIWQVAREHGPSPEFPVFPNLQETNQLFAEHMAAVVQYVLQRAQADITLAEVDPQRFAAHPEAWLPIELYRAAAVAVGRTLPAALTSSIEQCWHAHQQAIADTYQEKISTNRAKDAEVLAKKERVAHENQNSQARLMAEGLPPDFAENSDLYRYLPMVHGQAWQQLHAEAASMDKRIDFHFLEQVNQASLESVFVIESPGRDQASLKEGLQRYLDQTLQLYRQDVSSLNPVSKSKDHRCWLRAAWLSIIAGGADPVGQLQRFQTFFSDVTHLPIGKWQHWMIGEEFQRARSNLPAFLLEQHPNCRSDSAPGFLGSASMHDSAAYRLDNPNVQRGMGLTDQEMATLRQSQAKMTFLSSKNLEACLLELSKSAVGLHAKRYPGCLGWLRSMNHVSLKPAELLSAIHATLGQDMLLIEVQRRGGGETGVIDGISCRVVTATPGDTSWQERLRAANLSVPTHANPSANPGDHSGSSQTIDNDTPEMLGLVLQELEQRGASSLAFGALQGSDEIDVRNIFESFRNKPVLWLEAQHYVVYLPKHFQRQANTSRQVGSWQAGGSQMAGWLAPASSGSAMDWENAAARNQAVTPPAQANRLGTGAIQDLAIVNAGLSEEEALAQAMAISQAEAAASSLANPASSQPMETAAVAATATASLPSIDLSLPLDQRCLQWFELNQHRFVAGSIYTNRAELRKLTSAKNWQLAQTFANEINWNGRVDIAMFKKIRATSSVFHPFLGHLSDFMAMLAFKDFREQQKMRKAQA